MVDSCKVIDTLKNKLVGGDSSVCCSKDVCQKTFDRDETYQKERSIYQLGLPYIPTLLRADDETRTLYIEKRGSPLGTVQNSGLTFRWKIGKKDIPELWHRRRYCSRICSLATRFREDTGIHHNDISFKNILVDDTDALYLIDFEHAHHNYRDMNGDFILPYPPIFTVGVGVLVVLAIIMVTRKTRSH